MVFLKNERGNYSICKSKRIKRNGKSPSRPIVLQKLGRYRYWKAEDIVEDFMREYPNEIKNKKQYLKLFNDIEAIPWYKDNPKFQGSKDEKLHNEITKNKIFTQYLFNTIKSSQYRALYHQDKAKGYSEDIASLNLEKVKEYSLRNKRIGTLVGRTIRTTDDTKKYTGYNQIRLPPGYAKFIERFRNKKKWLTEEEKQRLIRNISKEIKKHGHLNKHPALYL
ncbi:hypothetical protein HYS31_04700 [Candidatus Woesearchaeota archaeon]|nr:hypothetical protein [Candidatus Woesearchaeota archaeon]